MSRSLRGGLLAVALSRIVRAAGAPPPVEPVGGPSTGDRVADAAAGDPPAISVVVPARDEAERVAGAVAPLVGAPGVVEVVVVDDRSADATAAVAARAGARVIVGVDPPAGWAGKTWALEQGRREASGRWVVTVDADVRPDPRLPLSVVRRAERDGCSLVTAAGRFDCPTLGARWLHASMLTTLVYRFGPPGTSRVAARSLANGQCMAFDAGTMTAAGGFAPVAGEVVEDVALVRAWATAGRRVGFVDAAELMTVRMYEDLRSTWSGWGRSLALPGVERGARQAFDIATIAATMPLPLLRLVTGRADVIDVVALLARAGTLAGTRRAYGAVDAAYWASPLADPIATAALVGSAARRRQRWKGREYRL